MGDASKFSIPVKLFRSLETMIPIFRTLTRRTTTYEELSLLQLRVTRSSAALAIFHSALILSGSTGASSVSAAPVDKGEDRARAVAQIRSVLRAQQDAWNRGDIDGFMNGYARSASTIFITEDTVRRGWQTVRDRYRENIPIA
jgi:hypothetical protein